ncbi:hypothetical protein BT69DRAFT_1320867 [Atractiella rhizophila]|nr:hypothetical protein BT69DRAFT_1320867 [Atractiella rhizophila]
MPERTKFQRQLSHLNFIEWILAGDEQDDRKDALKAQQKKKERMRLLMRKLGREKAIYHRNQVTPEKVWTEKSDNGDVILLTKFRSGEVVIDNSPTTLLEARSGPMNNKSRRRIPKILDFDFARRLHLPVWLESLRQKGNRIEGRWIATFTNGALVIFTKWRFGQVTWESHTEGYVYGCVETDVYMAGTTLISASFI